MPRLVISSRTNQSFAGPEQVVAWDRFRLLKPVALLGGEYGLNNFREQKLPAREVIAPPSATACVWHATAKPSGPTRTRFFFRCLAADSRRRRWEDSTF